MEVLQIFLCIFLLTVKRTTGFETYKLISGLQIERVPSPSSHFYREYVPLVYQFSVPRWNKTNTFIVGSQTCNTTSYTKFFTTCPILYYLTEMNDRFSEYLENNQPLVVNLEDIGAKPETALVSFDCELIQPHFEDIFMDKATLDEYLTRLKSCSPLGSKEFIQRINNYVYNISGIYKDMRQKFYSEYWLKIDLLDGRVDAALWANAVNTINSLIYQNYMMEANRWKMAVLDCEAGRIPSTLLPPSLISDTLSDMLETLSSQNLLPTVSTDSVGNYYKSKLTDCTFTNDTFTTRILIPVLPSKEKFLLAKITPLPFYYRDTRTQTDWECQIDSAVLPSGVSSEHEDTYVLVDLVNNVAYESDCKPGKLCHIPTALHPRRISPCATAAFNWERNKSNSDTARMNLVNECPVTCSPLTTHRNEMLKLLAPFEFFWFHGDKNLSKEGLRVECTAADHVRNAAGTMRVFYPYVDYGAQVFEINCNCELHYQSQVYKAKPCSSLQASSKDTKISTTIVAPIQWYSEDTLNRNGIKEVWHVPPTFFAKPDVNLIAQSIKRRENVYQSAQVDSISAPSTQSSSVFISFFTLLLLVLAIVVVALAWRLHSLIQQLQQMGFNVKSQGSYNVAGSTGNGGGQQVAYRNMGSLVDVDTDNLLINETR